MTVEKRTFSSSLYPSFEVEVDGQVFKIMAVNRAVFDTMADLAAMVEAGDPKAVGKVYDQVALVLDAPIEFINKLDYRIIRDLMKFINDEVIRPDIQREQKNESEPGAQPST